MRGQEYWNWQAIALFVLITVDMLTTVHAARVVGTTGEAHPRHPVVAARRPADVLGD